MIKKLFSHSLVYGLTGVFSTLSATLLVPIYTRILNPADYGVVSLLTTFTAILVIILNLGLSSAIFWAYFRAENEEERKKIIGTSFLFLTAFNLAIILGLFLFSGKLNELLFPDSQPSVYLRIALATAFVHAGIAIPLAVFRALQKPTIYVIISIGNLLLNITFAILLVAILRIGVLGVFLAALISQTIVYLVSVPLILKNSSLTISKKWLFEMLSFGVPMVPAGLAMWVLNSSDRYFLGHLVGLESVGIYNVGYRLAMFLTLVTAAVQLAYPPFMFSIEKRKDAKRIYSRFATYYFTALIFAAIFLSVFSKEVVFMLTGEEFHSAYIVVPFVSLSYVAYGMYFNFSTGVSLTKKTIYSSVSVLLASALNILLNFVLIAKYGLLGAAFSTLVSFWALAVLILFFSNKYYPIPYQFGKMAKILLLALAVLLLSSLADFQIWISILVKSVLMISFVLVLLKVEIFDEVERGKARKILSRLFESKFNPKLLFNLIARELD